ncbi:hypothetical protein QJS04_geneDACA006972 [Acorus gramineus]|uniref:Late embryogenesis abundant protein LEA-2 subgroup domain-containing protein n=1 Tax=Acorus gramineus TaxID=55184 RepID=A0AAV9B027_ACOGR|nr:hypothetical protein QJS04_geneDACA006972 [Acorus gramineus]
MSIFPTHDSENPSSSNKSHDIIRRRRILCCSSVAAATAIVAVVILVLALTVFKVKEPIITMNSVNVQSFQLSMNPIKLNLTVIADVSFKNPNVVTFRYGNTTTTISYRGSTIGEVYGPSGVAPAHRTKRMNLTMDVLGDKLLKSPSLLTDVASGSLGMGSLTIIGGRVKILGFIKHHVDVILNCSYNFSVSTKSIPDHSCQQHLKF